MSESDGKSRCLGIHHSAGRTFCRVVEATSDAFDCRQIVEELWANHSLEVTNRYRKVFSREMLGLCGLPDELTENHLLGEIYRPHAFPMLLAERLVHLMTAGSMSRPVLLPACAGDPFRLAEIIGSRLRTRSAGGRCLTNFFKQCIAATGLAIGAAYSMFGVLSVGITSRRRSRVLPLTLTENLFIVFSGVSNHTRHIWREIQAIPEEVPPPTVLVLGQKPLEEELRLQVEKKGGRVIYPMCAADILPSIAALARCGWNFLRLQHLAEEDLAIKPGNGFNVRSGAWLLRGLMHDRFLRREAISRPENTVAVFGLIAHADSRLADLALRSRGVRTVHWLHGIVEDSLHYRGNSSICLCKNEVDSDLRDRYGCYSHCAVHPSPLPGRSFQEETRLAVLPDSGGLVITNLIHPDSRFAGFGASLALTELLRMAAHCFKSMGLQTFTWRPHPRESAIPEFRAFNQLAMDLGFTVDNKTDLDLQVRNHRHVITTFSGSIGDVAASGGVPAIFAGLPYEHEGHWGRLPDHLKFRSADELGEIFERLKDGPWISLQRQILLQQYNQQAPSIDPPANFFNSLRSIPLPPIV